MGGVPVSDNRVIKSEKVEVSLREIQSQWMLLIDGPNGMADGTLHRDFVSDHLPETARRMAECKPYKVYMVVEWQDE